MTKLPTHCRNGHEFDRSNIYIYPNGYRACRSCRKSRVSKIYRDRRRKLFELLGNKCQCSGEDCYHSGLCNVNDYRCLQIEHINGGGEQHRRLHGGPHELINFLINNPDSIKNVIQLMCANCNFVKLINKKESTGRPKVFKSQT